MMKIQLLLALLIIAAPSMASGNLTVVPSSLSPSFINTNVSIAMLNLTLNATVGPLNITLMNITVVGVNATNISSIEVKNETGSTMGINYTMNESLNQTTITISGMQITPSSNRSLVVAVSLYPNAPLLSGISLNLSSVDVGVDSGSNVSGFSAQSGSSQIQDVHANASVSPFYADTSVINQSFIFNIIPIGRNSFSNIMLTLPVQYPIVNVTTVRQGSNILYNDTTALALLSFNRTTGMINITSTSSDGFGTVGAIAINISVNTSASQVSAMLFNASLSGSNITFVTPYVSGTNTTVATQQLLYVNSVSVSKGTALSNGTDYWEFSMSMNITANVSGIVQFKMANWNNSLGQIMSLQSSSGNLTYYASLRDSANSSRIVNVTSEYQDSSGINLQNCCTIGTVYTLLLRMIIPAGSPSAASWYTTYSLLFRST